MCQSLIACILLPQLLAAIISPQSSPNRGGKDHGWRAATYRGLTIGKSTRADMLRILGKPFSSLASTDQDEPRTIIWNDYGVIQGCIGRESLR